MTSIVTHYDNICVSFPIERVSDSFRASLFCAALAIQKSSSIRALSDKSIVIMGAI